MAVAPWRAAALDERLFAEIFATPAARKAAISPDGQHVAAIVRRGLDTHVVLIPTAAPEAAKVVVQGHVGTEGFYYVNRHPLDLTWVTRSLFAVGYGWRAEAHDLNGKVVMTLGTAVIGRAKAAEADSGWLLVHTDDDGEQLGLVDPVTRQREALSWPMSGSLVNWALDQRGRLRALTLASSTFWSDTTTYTVWYLPRDAGDWVKAAEFSASEERWHPLVASADIDELIIASRHDRDTYAIYAYNPLTRTFGELLAAHPREDILRIDGLYGSHFSSVATEGMKPVRHWFEERWASLQTSVDRALPGRINGLSGNPHGTVLVHSYGDVDPGRWFLLDTTKMSLRRVLVARPRVDPARMRPMEVMHYRAADGLQIPSYLTRAASGTGPRPLVVMIHGGPADRDRWGWDAEVQLLAGHGWHVFQPQFRGSTGFGRAFEQAGFGEWGRAMQDDVTAGVRHLIDTGVADPARICIYGASYGGYAAVWGLVKTPELFRCGVMINGVSDIEYALSDPSDRNRSKIIREVQRHRIGEPKRDSARLREVSPLINAERISAPLFIAHGDQDDRVPIQHSRKLVRELEKHRKEFVWVPLADEGHALSEQGQRQLMRRVVEFLERFLGSPPPASVRHRDGESRDNTQATPGEPVVAAPAVAPPAVPSAPSR